MICNGSATRQRTRPKWTADGEIEDRQDNSRLYLTGFFERPCHLFQPRRRPTARPPSALRPASKDKTRTRGHDRDHSPPVSGEKPEMHIV